MVVDKVWANMSRMQGKAGDDFINKKIRRQIPVQNTNDSIF
jgi:hypothetical protein